ncbi:hypothetical protein AAVH_29345, partial [Aphelenchoides avenae]
DDVVFPAHRERLLAASPYFESLLKGDWKKVEEVLIEGCQPGAFRVLLRWIYGDEAVVDSIRQSTFVAVLLAAERFGIQDLVSRFVGLAEQLLAVTGSFFYEIFDMLDVPTSSPKRASRCLYYLDENAAAVMKHASFLDISDEQLMQILARESLCLREIDLYRAATKWARAQLQRANEPCTSQAIREVLGDALLLIRFPTMYPQEFKSRPAKDDILSDKEKLAIYGSFHGADHSSSAFNAELRAGASTLPLRHFTPTYCQECATKQPSNAMDAGSGSK